MDKQKIKSLQRSIYNLLKQGDLSEWKKKVLAIGYLLLDREDINENLQIRIDGLQYLEKELNVNFDNSKTFHETLEEIVSRISTALEFKKLREKKGLSLKQLAEELGFTVDHVKAMEEGKKPMNQSARAFIRRAVEAV